jgi:hypothetical protein
VHRGASVWRKRQPVQGQTQAEPCMPPARLTTLHQSQLCLLSKRHWLLPTSGLLHLLFPNTCPTLSHISLLLEPSILQVSTQMSPFLTELTSCQVLLSSPKPASPLAPLGLFFFFFSSAEDGTQGLAHGRQGLYLSYVPSPHLVVYTSTSVFV